MGVVRTDNILTHTILFDLNHALAKNENASLAEVIIKNLLHTEEERTKLLSENYQVVGLWVGPQDGVTHTCLVYMDTFTTLNGKKYPTWEVAPVEKEKTSSVTIHRPPTAKPETVYIFPEPET